LTLDRDKLAKILGLLSSDKSGEIVSAAQTAVALIRNANTSWAEVLKQSAVVDDGRTLFAELRLRAENEKLRETVMQPSAENQVLREQAREGWRTASWMAQSRAAKRYLRSPSHLRESHFVAVSPLLDIVTAGPALSASSFVIC